MHQTFKKWTMFLKMGLIMAIAAMVIVNPAWRAELQAQDESNGVQDYKECRINYILDRYLCRFDPYDSCVDDADASLEYCLGIDPNDPNKNSWR
jgi:hypothetical protein